MTEVDPKFSQDFRASYASVLWTMMILRWCDARWDRPQERAALEARFQAVEAKALGIGLKVAMEQAADDNARMMATMRLDTRCNGGFERVQEAAERALTEIEKLMTRAGGTG